MTDYKKLEKHFNKLPNDSERWRWLIDNQNLNITLWLDNDDTFATFDEEYDNEDPCILQFNDFIGNGFGVSTLLDVIGINNSSV